MITHPRTRSLPRTRLLIHMLTRVEGSNPHARHTGQPDRRGGPQDSHRDARVHSEPPVCVRGGTKDEGGRLLGAWAAGYRHEDHRPRAEL